MESQKLIIGIAGRAGSGKAVCAAELVRLAALANISAEKITFSDLLGQTLKEYDVPRTRENLQQLALFIDERRKGGLSYKMRQAIDASLCRLIVVDGLRWEGDFELVKSFEKSLLIHITASQEIRFARLKQRGHKPGEAQMSFEDFARVESVPTETQIEKLAADADVTIVNEGGLEEFANEIDRAWEEKIVPSLLS